MVKKMIVTDLDGTALRDWNTLDPYTKKALIEAKEAGHIVVIATGRPARASLHFYKELGLDTPIINFNGAYIHHPSDESFEDIIAEIPMDMIHEIFDSEIKEMVENAFCEYKDHLYVLDKESTIRDFFHLDTCDSVKYGSFKETLDQHPNGFLIETKPGFGKTVADYIKTHYSHEITCRTWGGELGNIIEVFKNETNKGVAIEKLAKHFNIEREHIIAFGDGDNDIEMIQYAHTGVVMENGIDELKAVANVQTKTNLNSGVGRYIYE
ncbi:MAG TPA: Cof-type HAD-IIB family hydrolase, partial [Firmicutes bacterium]|nr:Cof-type HAD-IIB family hydrolase [Bacillota bacterium]